MRKINIASFNKRLKASIIDVAILFTVIGIYFQFRSLKRYHNSIANRYLGLVVKTPGNNDVHLIPLFIRYILKFIAFTILVITIFLAVKYDLLVFIITFAMLIINFLCSVIFKRSVMDLITYTQVEDLNEGRFNHFGTAPSFMHRWGSFLIDSSIATIAITIVTLLHVEGFGISTSLIGSSIALLLQICFARRGSSIGKRLTGLIIVDEEGNFLIYYRRWLRSLTRIIEVGVAFPFTVSIFLAMGKRKSSIHDMIFHSRVVKKKKSS